MLNGRARSGDASRKKGAKWESIDWSLLLFISSVAVFGAVFDDSKYVELVTGCFYVVADLATEKSGLGRVTNYSSMIILTAPQCEFMISTYSRFCIRKCKVKASEPAFC